MPLPTRPPTRTPSPAPSPALSPAPSTSPEPDSVPPPLLCRRGRAIRRTGARRRRRRRRRDHPSTRPTANRRRMAMNSDGGIGFVLSLDAACAAQGGRPSGARRRSAHRRPRPHPRRCTRCADATRTTCSDSPGTMGNRHLPAQLMDDHSAHPARWRDRRHAARAGCRRARDRGRVRPGGRCVR